MCHQPGIPGWTDVYPGRKTFVLYWKMGSLTLLIVLDKDNPRLVLCGHIHEDPGITRTDKTIVVNCSMGKRGEGALVEIDKDITVKMLG